MCKTRHILFVDDDFACTEIAREELEETGYCVTTAMNGREAINFFKNDSNYYDLVITDFDMPFINGQQLAQEILSYCKNIPIILCTGNAKITTEEVQKWGVIELVRKPYDWNKVIDIIKPFMKNMNYTF